MSTDAPRLAGVIGWPISHSKSPILHNFWLKKYKITGHYIPIGLAAEELEKGIEALADLGFKGANVTVPYKEKILSMASNITDRAALIGAANTIMFKPDGSFRADNTDGYGFLKNIKQFAPDWQGSNGPVVVIGAGGASRAVVSALLDDGASEVRISNRTRHRAEILKDQFGAKVNVVDWSKLNQALDGAATIVNTTSLGMTGQPELKIRIDAAPKTALVTDIVYNPIKTELLRAAEDYGMRVVDGVGMLLHQAVPGFENWFDHRPEVESDVRNAVLSA
jgi:shikimate dehydrogenase